MQKQPGKRAVHWMVCPIQDIFTAGGEAGSQGAPLSDQHLGAPWTPGQPPRIFLFLPGTHRSVPQRNTRASHHSVKTIPPKRQRTGPGISYCFKSNIPFVGAVK